MEDEKWEINSEMMLDDEDYVPVTELCMFCEKGKVSVFFRLNFKLSWEWSRSGKTELCSFVESESQKIAKVSSPLFM